VNELTEKKQEFRRDLVDALRRELFGPYDGEDEAIRERPSQRYLLGRLAPHGTEVDPDEDDAAGDAAADADDADAGYASPISMAMNPSSIGLSFIAAANVGSLLVNARWGQYHEDVEETVHKDGRTGQRKVYRRTQVDATVALDLATATVHPSDIDLGVSVQAIVRPRQDGAHAVSVFLVNRREVRLDDRPEEDEWLFQPELIVRAADDGPAFLTRRLDEAHLDDPDLASMELLYWSRPEYAVGHGCAATWDASEGHGLANGVATTVLPAYELARIDPREDVEAELDMRALGGPGADGVSGRRLRELLMPLADAYRSWIEDLKAADLPVVEPSLRERALSHIEACEIAHERIVEGIELLAGSGEESRLAREAFCFAMRAMALQRERSVKALARRRGEEVPQEVRTRWRPFQLAFMLLNLPSMVDRGHRDRRVADLLWFPTGGGKTEAYLGLTAFALAHRRLRPPAAGYRNDVGVTVLMRYTLRLLTIQQFQRATTLICACEHLRLTEGFWGHEPFGIGLWVGRDATPNAYDEAFEEAGAKQALERIRNGHKPRKGSPAQLLSCPWCGAGLEGRIDYVADDDSESVKVFCSDDECDFSRVNAGDGLPVHMVDTQVYRQVPSLVIATVDKFARMPWNGRTQALFGRVQKRCPRHGFISYGEEHPDNHRESASQPKARVDATLPLEPPDLIIQDELHLISGPLGTLVGLYETAVDALASLRDDRDLHPPKVVASTATIRRADRQIAALFNRALQIFPPSGLRSTDSWFGKEVPVDDEPGRLYLGINAPGKSVKTALVRVYAALLSRAKALHRDDADAGDPYMTLVGYFNSLRELGGALRLIEDDVPGRIKVLNRRDNTFWPQRDLYVREELTSNKKAEEVPQILRMLERTHVAGVPKSGEYPVDTLLASNMISVGVDIDRLGVMVVNGQPKTTAEYIQATSRVGRQSPGLVITVFNWTRPRDLSHYERFRSYHGALYRFVEATSVTPFSSRARDKGLEGILTALIRLGDDDLTREQGAGDLERADKWVDDVIDTISRRATAVTGSADVGAQTREEIQQDLDLWEKAAVPGSFSYSARGRGVVKKGQPPPDRGYLLGEQEQVRHDGVFTAPGSLREVESEVHVYLAEVTTTAEGDGDD
jgi:hypothetical protein